MMKKYLFLMCLSLLTAITASAYDFTAVNSDGVTIYYTKNADGTTVYVTYDSTGTYSYQGDVVIPEKVIDTIYDYYVTGIGDNTFAGCTQLKSVTLPSSIKSIDDQAFKFCTGLTDLTVNVEKPWTITMGTNVFQNVNFEKVTLHVPDGSQTYYSQEPVWSQFTNIEIIPAYDFSVACSDGKLLYFNINADGTSVSLTYKDTNYKSYAGYVTVPEQVTYNDVTYAVTGIGNNAFYNCKELYTVTLPSGITTIGDEAFHFCQGLTSIELPSGVTTIGESCFAECTSMIFVDFGAALKTIGKNAFYYCIALRSIDLPNTVSAIGQEAFSTCESVETIYIPASVTTIGDQAFYNNSTGILQSVTVDNLYPSTLLLGSQIFKDTCCQDAILYVPEGSESSYNYDPWTYFAEVKAIETAAYDFMVTSPYGGYNLYFNINDDGETVSLTYKDDNYNSYKNYIDIPQTATYRGKTYIVTGIGASAFYRCSELASVTIPKTVTTIGEMAFANSSIGYVTVPSSVTNMNNMAFYNCENLSTATIEANVTTMGNNVFFGCTELLSVVLPSTLTEIGNGSFTACGKLESITIPEGVTSIGSDAFSECSALTEAKLPASLQTIGVGGFGQCVGLTKLDLPAAINYLDGFAFQGCTGLKEVRVHNPEPSTITMGMSVFYNVDVAHCTLYVPEGSKEKYETTDQWGYFNPIVEEAVSGIDNLNGDEPEAGNYYDLSGRSVINPTKGLYIHEGRKVLINR